ncbi:MAG: potassium/hydrogen antiporter [Gaiellaceae bacterium]|nr:potassium/hydrogen antiporter [Gaiellaceae bacterium]
MTEGEFLLVAGILLLGALGSAVVAQRLRLPALLLFLIVGMALGSDGAGLLAFDNYELARRIGTIALALILFDGGLSSGMAKLRPVLGPALRLAVFGTAITALTAGLAAAALFGLSPLKGLLLGSILASTDTAAVFGLIRGSTLRARLARTLEGEAGFNDPVAVLLVVGFIEWIQRPDYSIVEMLALFGKELLIGSVCGFLVGTLASAAFRRVRLPAAGLYPVASFAVAALSFGSAASLGGSGFLAIYLAGLLLADADIPGRQTIAIFHDGVAWVAQVALFLTLGLLVFPSQLGGAIGQALLLWIVLTVAARPLAVLVTTAFDRFSTGERVVLAAAGLRGGVAVLLATFPVTSGISGSLQFFNVVFFAVVLSTLVQGPAFEPLARTFDLTVNVPPLPRPLADFGTIRGLGAEVLEFTVLPGDGVVGRLVGELALPREVTLTVIVRGSDAVPPRAGTRIKAGDTLYLLARAEVEKQLRRLFEKWRDPVWEPNDEQVPVAVPTPSMRLLTQPWELHDGDPSDPDLVDGMPVLNRLRMRVDTGGALVVLEDGRYAVTGPSLTIGPSDILARYARRRAANSATGAEHRWWNEVATALPA